jgi:hypothetical protein
MSPILPPGTARVVLLWGARPSDLDIYMLAPHADPTKEACEVRWLPVPPLPFVLIGHAASFTPY